MLEKKIGKSSNGALGLGRRNESRGESAGRRSKGRDSLFLMATIRRQGDAEEALIPVRVRNLSEVGMMADYQDIAEPGDPVVVTIRGIGSVQAMVAWVKPGRIGITFDAEVDPLLARKPVGSQAASASTARRPA